MVFAHKAFGIKQMGPSKILSHLAKSMDEIVQWDYKNTRIRVHYVNYIVVE